MTAQTSEPADSTRLVRRSLWFFRQIVLFAFKLLLLVGRLLMRMYKLSRARKENNLIIEPGIDLNGDITYDGSGVPLNKK